MYQKSDIIRKIYIHKFYIYVLHLFYLTYFWNMKREQHFLLFINYFSLLGAMFPLPRVIYAMASDGLIFKWMGKVSSRFQTPFMGTLSAGLLTGSSTYLILIWSIRRYNLLMMYYRHSSGDIWTHAISQYDEYRYATGIFDCGLLCTYFTVRYHN